MTRDIIELDMFGKQGVVALAAVDHATRQPLFYRCYMRDSFDVQEALHECFTLHGFPRAVITDSAPWFTDKAFGDALAALGIQHVILTPFSGGERKAERYARR